MSNYDVPFPYTFYSAYMNSMLNSHEHAEIVHDIALCITSLSFIFFFIYM